MPDGLKSIKSADQVRSSLLRASFCCVISGETLNGQRLIEFRLGQEAGSEQGTELAVASAELMVRAETSAKARHLRYTLWAFTVHEPTKLASRNSSS